MDNNQDEIQRNLLKQLQAAIDKAGGAKGKPSFFEEEAKRIAGLNQSKQKPPLGKRIFYTFLGGLVALAVTAPIYLLFAAYDLFSYGFVAMKTWGWFIAPTFGIRPLSLVTSIGLLLFIRLVTHKLGKVDAAFLKGKTKLETVLRVLAVMAAPWVTLLFGYIFHLFM